MPKPTEDQAKLEAERRAKKMTEYLNSQEYHQVLLTRLKVNGACMESAEARAHTWALCERKDDPAEGCIFFIENFLWTFNPKEEPKNFPFILFDFQKDAVREFVNHIINGRDLLLEKSREMGASWLLFSAVAVWFWIFGDGVNFLMGSYKEDLVDNKTVDSLIGKIDYQITQLPQWLLPKGFNYKKHRTHMKLFNPENNNLITGDTMNPNFGRGSRKTAIMFDEHGFWQYAKDAWESAGDSTNCRISVSTPNGYNYFALLRETGIDVLTLHWKEHPLKDEEWYKFECARRTPEEIAQELDISYSRSREGRVYPEWSEENVILGEFPYDPDLPLYVSWDFGRSDDTAIIWSQPERDGLRIIDVYKKNNKNIDFFVPLITGMITHDNEYTYNEEEMKIIAERRRWGRATHFGDPAGRFQNNVVDYTVIDVLRKNGIHVNFKDNWKHFKIRKSSARDLISNKIYLNQNDRTKYFNMCMIQASYPSIKIEGVGMFRTEKPKHDWTSHYRSSFEYLAIGLSELDSKTHLKPYDKFKKKDIEKRSWGRRRAVGY